MLLDLTPAQTYRIRMFLRWYYSGMGAPVLTLQIPICLGSTIAISCLLLSLLSNALGAGQARGGPVG